MSIAPVIAVGAKGHATVAFPPDEGTESCVVVQATPPRVARTGGAGARAVIEHVVTLDAKLKAHGPSAPVMPHCDAGSTARTTSLGVFSAIQNVLPLLSQPTPNAEVVARLAGPPLPVTDPVPVPTTVVMVRSGATRRMR